MASVWYVGTKNERSIDSAAWHLATGNSYDEAVWNAINGWSLSESLFETEQLDILEADNDFRTGQPDTPRQWPAPTEPPTGAIGSGQSNYVYYIAALALYNAWLEGGGGGPGGGPVTAENVGYTGAPTEYNNAKKVFDFLFGTIIPDISRISLKSDAIQKANAYIDFTTKDLGDPPSFLDTGQLVDYTLQLVGGRKPKITSAGLARGDVNLGTGAYADYYQAECDDDVLYAGTDFTVNSADGSTQGVMCLAVWDGFIEGAGTLIPKSPAHITVDTLTGQTTWWVCDGTDNNHLKAIKIWNITPPASNGIANWNVTVMLYPEEGKGVMVLPGPVSSGVDAGKTIVEITDAEINAFMVANWPAIPAGPFTFANLCSGSNVVMVEHQCNVTVLTARMPVFQNMYGSVHNPIRDLMFEIQTRNLAVEVATHAATSKVTPANADEIPLIDSEAGWGRKKLTWQNLWTRVQDIIASSAITLYNKTHSAPKIGTILDTNCAAMINMSPTTTAVNYFMLLNAAAGGALGIRATGTSTDIALNIRSKGADDRNVTLGSAADRIMTLLQHFIDEDSFASDSATKAPSQQSVKAYVAAQIAALIGAAPAELDTWMELVSAITSNEDALAGIVSSLAEKATPTDISNAITALIGGATTAGNTLKKLEDLIASIESSSGENHYIVFGVPTPGAWPARPVSALPAIWVGGDAPDDFPAEHESGDVWIPATGDNVDLGLTLEALQALTATANTIPYFSALNVAASLILRTSMPTTPLDTDVLSAAATKLYVDRLPTQAAKTAAYSLQATDRNTCLEYDNTTAATFTVDNVFAAGDIVSFRSINTGALTIAAGTGVTLSVYGGTTFKLAGQWAEASIHFRTATHAILTGNLVV